MRNLRNLSRIANLLNREFLVPAGPFWKILNKIPISECDNIKIEVLEGRIYPAKFGSEDSLKEVKRIKKALLSELSKNDFEANEVESVRVLIDLMEENGKRKFVAKSKIFVKGKEFSSVLEYPK